MGTSIYTRPVLQLLPRTVDIWGDALLSQKNNLDLKTVLLDFYVHMKVVGLCLTKFV